LQSFCKQEVIYLIISITMSELFKYIEAEYTEKRASIPNFKAGDTINVHVKIREGNKERVQQFQGTVIQRKNTSTNGESFTVRKVSNGVGVERIFPLLSPSIDKIELVRQGVVRRARLYYLRGKAGKAARIKEKKAVQA
jgi:large subunit ribosomal protein L19